METGKENFFERISFFHNEELNHRCEEYTNHKQFSIFKTFLDIDKHRETEIPTWISNTPVKKKKSSWLSLFTEYSNLNNALIGLDTAKQDLDSIKSKYVLFKEWTSNIEPEAVSEEIKEDLSGATIATSWFSNEDTLEILKSNFSTLHDIETIHWGSEQYDFDFINLVYERIISLSRKRVKLWSTAVKFHQANIKRLTENSLSKPYNSQKNIFVKTFPGSGKVEDEIKRSAFSCFISNKFHFVTNFINDKKSKATEPEFIERSDLRREKQNIAA